MVVSHRESNISSNIRAIIEQLNLNPVERRRLIERHDEIDNCRILIESQKAPRVSIGVYGLRNNENCKEIRIHATKKVTPPRQRQRIPPKLEEPEEKDQEEKIDIVEVARKDSSPTANAPEFVTSSPKQEDLPELPTGSLNHTAAHHRISVRPKNRRPPRRSTSHNSSENGFSRIDTISETSNDLNQPMEDSLEPVNDSILDDSMSSPVHPEPPQRPTSILRKSSSRASKTSVDHPQVVIVSKKPAFSPDSLDSPNHDSSKSSSEMLHDFEERSKLPRPSPRPSSDIITDKIVLLRRRTSSTSNTNYRLSKSPDSLESETPESPKSQDLDDHEINPRPVAAKRLLLNSISKSSEVVCKSSDSLEAFNNDLMDQQRRRSKNISKSFECFESLGNSDVKDKEKRKRATVSEINLCRGRVGSSAGKLAWKSSESFDKMAMILDSSKLRTKDDENDSGILEMHGSCWRSSARRTNHSSESSDNLDIDEVKSESRTRSRRSMPQVINSTFKDENGQRVVSIVRQPSTSSTGRLQKSSESSELGSTDTLDSERRHMKSSDSDETLDSLEKDLEHDHDRKDMEISDNKEYRSSLMDSAEEVGGSLAWRQRSSSHELKNHNLDIHSLIAYNLTKPENGNHDNDEKSHVTSMFQKKKNPQLVSSTSENNKIFTSLTNNLLSTKNDEDLQNMLNGNISEVSTTDTKSFKEKLIMFEKLGK